ncbi:DUF1775 domain-containing protein [Tropicimonas sp. IMCC34011]|uniref:DUF1775 domain-containing protein n=1 Tax=Tropicimonas sp. IMCC34011 TaxID=2248759 RepID=UPI000E250823|nr:DUF1775 domain-containing protein [Tropicimonas sp. IMCC34011]
MFAKTTLAASAALSLMSGAAFAHATLEQSEAAIGSTTKITLRVPHGCDGEATNDVRIEIPDGFYNVKPMPKAGWSLSTETGAYDVPFNNHGTEMTEGVRVVTWSGGDLPDAYYDEFTLRGTVGPDEAAGKAMYFPAVQTCATGTADWTDTGGSGHDVPNPAPFLTLVAGEDDHGHHGHSHGAAEGDAASVGDLRITGASLQATAPNQPVAGGYMTVANTGETDDVLISVSSSVSRRGEVHEMSMDGDVMRMREVEGGLSIPAGETVTLEPGGLHIMLMDLEGPLSEGESAEVTLTFEEAGDVTLTLPIVSRQRGGHDGHGEHTHH